MFDAGIPRILGVLGFRARVQGFGPGVILGLESLGLLGLLRLSGHQSANRRMELLV